MQVCVAVYEFFQRAGQSRITVVWDMAVLPLTICIKQKDGSSPAPGALLALTLGSCGCRLQHWPLALQTLRFCRTVRSLSNGAEREVLLRINALVLFGVVPFADYTLKTMPHTLAAAVTDP